MTNVLIVLTLHSRHHYRERIKALFPDLNVEMVDHRSKAQPYLAETDVLISFAPMLSDQILQDAANLKWVQALGTGLDNLIDQPSLRKDVLVTSMHGIHGAPVSEAALGSMLALCRHVPACVRAQDAGNWERPMPTLLHNKTVGIFGIGVIAEALAPKCKAMGMKVVGITSTPRDVPGFDRVVSRDDLVEAVREFDFFVLLTPLTAETRGIVNAEVLGAMKPNSYLINVARGGVVDEPALVEVMREGRIAGAALDVFAQEPLPADHPFWAMKNVMITAHLAGFCDVYVDFAMPIIEHNMRCFLAGTPDKMINRAEH